MPRNTGGQHNAVGAEGAAAGGDGHVGEGSAQHCANVGEGGGLEVVADAQRRVEVAGTS
jgi:hypothetical protein